MLAHATCFGLTLWALVPCSSVYPVFIQRNGIALEYTFVWVFSGYLVNNIDLFEGFYELMMKFCLLQKPILLESTVWNWVLRRIVCNSPLVSISLVSLKKKHSYCHCSVSNVEDKACGPWSHNGGIQPSVSVTLCRSLGIIFWILLLALFYLNSFLES